MAFSHGATEARRLGVSILSILLILSETPLPLRASMSPCETSSWGAMRSSRPANESADPSADSIIRLFDNSIISPFSSGFVPAQATKAPTAKTSSACCALGSTRKRDASRETSRRCATTHAASVVIAAPNRRMSVKKPVNEPRLYQMPRTAGASAMRPDLSAPSVDYSIIRLFDYFYRMISSVPRGSNGEGQSMTSTLPSGASAPPRYTPIAVSPSGTCSSSSAVRFASM